MVIEAARGALSGLSLDRLADTVKKMIPISHMIQTADTLKYLYMGGRIGKAQELLGSVLNIKPLIGVEDGLIVPLGKARSRGLKLHQNRTARRTTHALPLRFATGTLRSPTGMLRNGGQCQGGREG